MLNKDELNTLADEIRKVIVDNPDMIISVGYCVKSKNGIIFRKWANNVLKDYESNEDAKKWVKLLIERKKECFPRVTYDDIPLKPQSVIREISEVLTPDSILTTDVGQNQMWAAHFYDTQKPRKFISSGGLGTMGFGLPAAIGAKVACPEDPVVSINGDGGFLMVCQELATIKDYDIPVIAVVLENRTLGMVYQWQNLLYNGRYEFSSASSAR